MGKQGSIYKITCIHTGLAYVGQTRDTKTKGGREYAYGVVGRWNDHLSCPASTPLGTAISTYGKDGFTVETLESHVPEDRLDEREAYWIQFCATITPNGYNVMRHGRCRHRDSTSLSEFYAPTTTGVRLRQICRDRAPSLIYAYLQQASGEEVRVVFGQGKDSSYNDAIRCAKEFLEPLASVPIDADPRIFDSTANEFTAKISRFDGINISRIRIAKFNTLAAVYIDKERICFGGKRTMYPEAVEKASAFAHALQVKHPEAVIVDNSCVKEASKSATGGCPLS
jgi:hypothetical protein